MEWQVQMKFQQFSGTHSKQDYLLSWLTFIVFLKVSFGPAEWKMANVFPLYKKYGKVKDVSAYRPKSLTSPLLPLLTKEINEKHLISKSSMVFDLDSQPLQTFSLVITQCGGFWTKTIRPMLSVYTFKKHLTKSHTIFSSNKHKNMKVSGSGAARISVRGGTFQGVGLVGDPGG